MIKKNNTPWENGVWGFKKYTGYIYDPHPLKKKVGEKMARRKKINLDKLREYFEKNDNEKSKLALSLINRAVFLNKTLDDLEKEINESGVITVMQQGDYEIERENPALKSYNTTIKNYTTLIKQLFDMLPKNIGENEKDDFDAFCEEEC